MKLERTKIIKHLERIMTRGQVNEAAFTGGFASTALTADQLLMVVAPPLPGAEDLAEEIGIVDLSILIKALTVLADPENPAQDVDLSVVKTRLVINEPGRGVQKLILAQPRVIGTRVPADLIPKIIDKAAAADSDIRLALTPQLIAGITATYSGYRASEVEIFIGPKGGKIRVGGIDSNFAEFATPELVADEEYSLLFGQHLIDALYQCAGSTGVVVCFGDAQTLISIFDGEYQYLLAPRRRSTDDQQAAAKQAAANGPDAADGGSEPAAPKAAAKKKSTSKKK